MNAVVLALALALPSQVAVDTRSTDAGVMQARGELIATLLAAGHRVTADGDGAQAAAVVRRSAKGGLLVAVSGDVPAVFPLPARPKAARAATLKQAVAALGGPHQAGTTRALSVAIAALPDAQLQDGAVLRAQSALLNTLLGAGLTLVGKGGPRDARLCVALTSDGALLSAGPATERCQAAQERVEAAPKGRYLARLSEVGLKLSQRALGVGFEVDDGPKNKLLSSRPLALDGSDAPLSEQLKVRSLSFSASAGLLGRASKGDPNLALGLRTGHLGELGAGLTLDTTLARQGGVVALDALALVGGVFQQPIGAGFDALLGFYAGVQLHTATLGEQRFTAANPAFAAQLGVRYHILGPVFFEGVSTTWSGARRVYTKDRQIAWERDSIAYGLRVGLSVTLDL